MQQIAQCSPIGPRHSEVIDGDVIVRTDELAPAKEELEALAAGVELRRLH